MFEQKMQEVNATTTTSTKFSHGGSAVGNMSHIIIKDNQIYNDFMYD